MNAGNHSLTARARACTHANRSTPFLPGFVARFLDRAHGIAAQTLLAVAAAFRSLRMNFIAIAGRVAEQLNVGEEAACPLTGQLFEFAAAVTETEISRRPSRGVDEVVNSSRPVARYAPRLCYFAQD